MSEYNKAQPYDVYEYNPAQRAGPGHDYTDFGAHPPFEGPYVGPPVQAQVPSGLPQSSAVLGLLSPAQHYGTHDPTYYGHQQVPYPATYLEPPPRRVPEIISYTPTQGHPGTRVTLHFQSVYDFDTPQLMTFIMFGQKRCQSVLSRTAQIGGVYQYTITADAPSLAGASPLSTVPLHLALDSTSVSWESPSIEFGNFTYVEPPACYPLDASEGAARKRKLSLHASPRRSPVKKASLQQIAESATSQSHPYGSAPSPSVTQSPSFRRPSMPELYPQTRRVSGPQYLPPAYNPPFAAGFPQHYSGVHTGQTTPLLQAARSPSWNHTSAAPSVTRSPSASTMTVGSKNTQLLPPSGAVNNPTLVRTSALQTSSPPSSASAPNADFNPYTIHPSNATATLRIDGDLNSMSDKWTAGEWETKRRLVQFRRSQSGSTISATFEPVALEDRLPNSICVSCIWWEEKQGCYVTSVDAISLLESLVAVRFTVEEKNRIRRNLEGFRPLTVSKGKADSGEFFKLIMGFPNPKPRNIEKDVKVFPWRIFATALKKIIGKYSASYSSTVGAMPITLAPTHPAHRASDAGVEQRPGASPLSTASSATSHGYAYPPLMPANPYASNGGSSAGLGIGPSAGTPDLRLAVPASAAGQAQTTSWHQPSAHYHPDLPTRNSWDFGTYLTPLSASVLPTPTQVYGFQQSYPPPAGSSRVRAPEAGLIALPEYEDGSQPTSTS